MTILVVTALYLVALVGLGVASNRRLQGTGEDYFLASHSIGPVMMLLSMFGATMTSFAIVGSTGKAYTLGVGTYGLMASWAAVAHPLMFTVIGARAWQLGQRHGYVTQIQLLRDRFRSDLLGWLIFPVLVLLVVPYILMGIQSAGTFFATVTAEVLPPKGVPAWLTGLAVTVVTLAYIFLGGIRAAAWANALQTAIFLLVAVITFGAIMVSLGGPAAAIAATAERRPDLLVRTEHVGQLHFLSYGLVGLSVGAFPHVFQHWLTARSDRDLKLSVVAHPILVMTVWLPCVLIGLWAAGQTFDVPPKPNAVLGAMVAEHSGPWLAAVLSAGIVAAIMSSLDSQFMALGTMFANDVVLHRNPDLTEARKVWLGRAFVVAVALVSWFLSLFASRSVFEVGVWTFSGFSGLVPVFVAALYWRRATAAGAIASVLALSATWLGFVGHALWTGAEGEPLVWGLMPIVFMVAASTAALVGVSLVTRPPPAEALARFFPDEGTPEADRRSA